MNKPTFKEICLMYIQQLTNFPYIEKDFDALTDYGLLCKIVDKLNEVIINTNEQDGYIVSLYNAFIELKTYVENFFDNLDVQEEINNKLDEMAEDGTLQEIISAYISNKAEYIFTKFMPEAYSGDCEIIKYKDKVIMIDTYHPDQYNYIKQMLIDNNISHIDYLIITHYHIDHSGNFQNLVNDDYVDNSTIIYFPAEVTKFSDYASIPDTMKQYCIDNNLVYRTPNEYEYFEIDNLKLTFYNCDPVLLDRIYYDQASYKDYNNCSTICLVEHNDIKVLYTGDILEAGIERLYNSGLIKGKIDLYKVCHHGINVNTFTKLFELMTPKFAVQTTGIMDEIINNFTIGQETSLIRELGTIIYATSRQNNYLKFSSFANNINCEVGIPNYLSHRRIEETLYVDILASTNQIQDGSQAHPFSQIGQAIGYIESHPTRSYIINCADGNYFEVNTASKKRMITHLGKDVRITINGNSNDRTKVSINACEIYNSHITFNNLTIYSNERQGIESFNSYLNLNNVLITSSTGEVSSYAGLTLRDGSKCIITGSSKIDLNAQAINCFDSDLFIRSLVIGTNTRSKIIDKSNSNIITDSIDFINNSDKLNFNDNNTIRNNSQQIFSGNEYTEVTLSKSSSNFEWLEIYYVSSDGNRGSTGKIYDPNGKKASVICPQYNGTVVNNKQCRFEINDNIISITNHLNINISSAGVVTLDNSNNVIRITKVIGGFNDYVAR